MKRLLTLVCIVMAIATTTMAETANNGLPARVTLPGNWGDVKIWKTSFDASTYPGFKIVMKHRPNAGEVQLFYRNAAQAAAYSGTYLTWEPGDEDMSVLSEDGRVLMGYFDPEKLEGDNVITEFAIQNRTGNTVEVIIEAVYLLDENENEIPTEGLYSSGWNGGTFEPLGPGESGYKPEAMEILTSGGAALVKPESDGNGLPALVSIPGTYGDVKLSSTSFDATQYPGFKVVLREKPVEGTLQLYYRNAAQAAEFTGTYLTWEPGDEDMTVLSDDGLVLMGYFDPEKLEGDNVITEFAMQNRGSNTVTAIIEHVYLLDEDDKEIISSGLAATGWNPATITSLADGDKYSSKVKWTSTGKVGPYSGKVEAGTYHKYSFVLDRKLPEGFEVRCTNQGNNVEISVSENDSLEVCVGSDYDDLSIVCSDPLLSFPVIIDFKSITRLIVEGSMPVTAVEDIHENVISRTYFDMTGKAVRNPVSGIYIIRETYSNGKVKVIKQIMTE